MNVSSTYRALIVEDEASSREYLNALLAAHHPAIEVIGQAADVPAAIGLCAARRPNLLFLDVRLGSRDGFDLLAALDYEPRVIFITGRTDFAIRAFEVNAVDYLMKPLFQSRLDAALSRLPALPPPDGGKTLLSTHHHHQPEQAVPGDRKIASVFLSGESGTDYVLVERISLIRASGNYSKVHLADWRKPALIYRGIQQWMELLPAHPFLQINRSIIVNVRCIESLTYLTPISATLRITGFDEPIRIGRGAIKRLKPLLK
jgi:two-component system LytT family response regulator